MTTVIVSGVNKGLGLGLLKIYAARPDYTVIGTTLGDVELSDIPTGENSRVITVALDQTDVDAPARAMNKLRNEHGITKIDIGIANAGLCTPKTWCRIEDIEPQAFEDHWRVKGTLLFFQAVLPLLQSGSKFAFISSHAGVLDRVPDRQNVCYGITKAGTSYLGRYAHFEHPEMIIFPVDPGWVATDMGNFTAGKLGTVAPLTIEQSTSGLSACLTTDLLAGIADIIDKATRETHGGKLCRYDGTFGVW